jgi:hypothetical protein
VSELAGVRIRNLPRITAAEFRLLVEAQATLIACQAVKWRRPVGSLLQRNVAEETADVPLDYGTRKAVGSVQWAVSRSARHGVFRPQCLVRAMAIQKMLHRRGIVTARINIGVSMQSGAFEAHAWVELNGAVVGDSAENVGRFTKVSDVRLIKL